MSLTVHALARQFATAPDSLLDKYTVRVATPDGTVYETDSPYVDPLTHSLIFSAKSKIDLTQHERAGFIGDDTERQRIRAKRNLALDIAKGQETGR